MRLRNLALLAVLLASSTALISCSNRTADVGGQAAHNEPAQVAEQQVMREDRVDLPQAAALQVVPKITAHEIALNRVVPTVSTKKTQETKQQNSSPKTVDLAQTDAVPAPPPPATMALNIDGRSIDGFRSKLAALEAGRLDGPITILHIGDSHIADDSFSRGVRQRLQARFGNAGRGAVIPANAFPRANEAGVQLAASGGWSGSMSLRNKDGVYGVSGVRVDGSSPNAVMKLSSETEFDRVGITVATGPSQGGFTVSVSGKDYRFSSQSPQTGAKTFEFAARGTNLQIRPDGNGNVALLNWSTTRDQAGIRYVNFGQIGATLRVTQRWNATAVANDVKAIKPDLIVYGFGTNEGFDSNTDLVAYRKTATEFINRLKASAPDAAVVIIGASDSLKRGGSGCGNGWSSPPKLAGVRETMKSVAQDIGAFYWDWSQAMGGQCSISRWATLGLGSPDHIHLTAKGYQLSAEKFTAALLGPLGTKPFNVAAQ